MTANHSGSVPKFNRARGGYDQTAVDKYLDEVRVEQQSLLDEVQTLRAQLAALRDENAVLKETSPSAHAVTDRMAKMLRIAVDQVSQMQSEARAEAAAMVAKAKSDLEDTRTKNKSILADLATRQRALESEHAEVLRRAHEEAEQLMAQTVNEIDRLRAADMRRREKAEQELDAELIELRTEAKFQIDEETRISQQACERRLNDAKAEADRRLRVADEQIESRFGEARQTLEDMHQQRIIILEQLSDIYKKLDDVPALLEAVRRADKQDSLPRGNTARAALVLATVDAK